MGSVNSLIKKEDEMSVAKQQDRYVNISTYKIRYWSRGKKVKIIVLIHGIGGSVELDWMYNFKPLSAHNQVYGLDLLGFGLSDKPDKPKYSFSLDGWAQLVKDFMDVLDINTASLVGLSLGGGVALQFAIQFPDKVDKLIIVDSAGLGRETHPMFKVLSIPLIGNLLFKPSLKNSEKAWKSVVYYPSAVTDEIVKTDYRLSTMPGFKKIFLHTIQKGCTIRGLRPSIYKSILSGLSAIKNPTLIIWGRQDPVFPLQHAYIAEEKIPEAQLHIFDNCGHIPPIEYPEGFNKIVNDFISS